MYFDTRAKQLLLSASTLLVFAIPLAQAQEAEPEDIDEVVATGIRASVNKSLDDKRRAQQIIDTINAEDIGKSTDQNIAEALNRVSGVSINRADGEGSTISIRGAGPQQTVVTLNGAALGSTGFNQAVDLSDFSSDILSKVEVIKTPSADDEEGSLGGLVNLITRKPLEIDKNIRSVTAEGRYRPFGDNFDYKLSGVASQKFLDDRLGVFVNVTQETDTVRRDDILFENYRQGESFLASDQNGNILSNQSLNDQVVAAGGTADPFAPVVFGIVPDFNNFEQRFVERDRLAIDGSIQWEVTPRTNITLSGNYAVQDVDSSLNSVRTRNRPVNLNLVAGAQPDGVFGGTPPPVPTVSDPQQDFHVIDTETRTFTRFVNRFGLGDISAAINETQDTNLTLSAEVNHEFTDNFRAKFGGSIQRAEQDPGTNIFVSAQNFADAPPRVLVNIPASDLEPVGFDCTSGECTLVAGTTPADLGAVNATFTTDEILALGFISRADDNVLTSGFVPDDLNAQHLAFLSQTISSVEDEQDVLFADFDWDVNKFGVTSFEFGGKYTGRRKFVDNQNGPVIALNPAISVLQPGTDLPIVVQNGLTDIPATAFANGVAGDSDFLDGLNTPRNQFTDGFPAFDPLLAFNTVANNPDFAFDLNNLETRSADFDNYAAYAKVNYSVLDDRLKGDFGLRYIRTDVESSGFAGVNFFRFDNQNRVYDPFRLRQLADTSLPQCPDLFALGAFPGGQFIPGSGPLGLNVDAIRTVRVDGFGFTRDVNDPTNLALVQQIPDAGPCFDPIVASGTLDFGGGPFAAFNDFWLGRHSDLSTSSFFYNFDENGSLILGEDGLPIVEDLTSVSTPAFGSNQYERFLPSFNASYAFNNELIGRFAFSKTISRPPIDSIRPGGIVNEQAFGFGSGARPGNTVQLFNPELDPLESINFDVGLEWYFAPGGLLSANFFSKSIEGRTVAVQDTVFLQDLRALTPVPEPAVDINIGTNILLSEDELTEGNCFPRRFFANDISLQEDTIRNGSLSELCNIFLLDQEINGEDASIRGIELQYSQNYDFLPGWLSGFGVLANYTFQYSDFEDIDGTSFPVEETPRHSWNVTGFWQKGGHQARLAWSGTTDVLVQRTVFGTGASFRDGRSSLDFSGNYQLKDNVQLTFQAVNLLDESFRTYFTSRFIELPVDPAAPFNQPLADVQFAAFDEGNALETGATQSRTIREFKTGQIFRIGVRVDF